MLRSIRLIFFVANTSTPTSLNAEPILTRRSSRPPISVGEVVTTSGISASMPEILRDTTLEEFLQAIERVRTHSLLPEKENDFDDGED